MTTRRALNEDLFALAGRVLTADGCLILCRPGGLADPAWLMQAAERNEWECRHALAWRRGPAKLGDGKAPYTSATERLLVFAKAGVELANHDGSSRCDILEVSQRRKSHTLADQHLFDKPVELMELLIQKHTFPGEAVVEPFGATGPVSRACIRLNRRWVYCESNQANYELGSGLIAQEVSRSLKQAV